MDDFGINALEVPRILIRHLFPHGFEPTVHTRSLTHMIPSEMAGDIMNRELIHALEDDSLDKVVERMIKAGVRKIVALDGEKRLVGEERFANPPKKEIENEEIVDCCRRRHRSGAGRTVLRRF